ncbi:MAG: AAA family ATPase [Candidatus Melainabacteria bacterium]|nr:MAG: AAA family ATPase [Candidatus Melainabacteria bacterium]
MKRLLLLVGIPGSGKTTLAEKLIEKGYHCLNADSIRRELYGDASAQGDPEQVFAIFSNSLKRL